MSSVVRCVTTQAKTHVLYEVFVNGERKWVTTVFFGRDAQRRAGGPAFKQAAREQDAQAKRLMAEVS